MRQMAMPSSAMAVQAQMLLNAISMSLSVKKDIS